MTTTPTSDNDAMCHERERLIGYVYDECDADERRQVQSHLDSCEACQQEVQALRAVRQDLLGWEVPPHESVWRPFAPVRVAPSWRDVSTWALAAAAGVIFAVGLAGGVAARDWLVTTPTMAEAAPATVAVSPAPDQTPEVLTVAELEQAEARIKAELGRMLSERVAVLEARQAAEPRAVSQSELQQVRAKLVQVEEMLRSQVQFAISVNNDRASRALSLNQAALRPGLTQIGFTPSTER